MAMSGHVEHLFDRCIARRDRNADVFDSEQIAHGHVNLACAGHALHAVASEARRHRFVHEQNPRSSIDSRTSGR